MPRIMWVVLGAALGACSGGNRAEPKTTASPSKAPTSCPAATDQLTAFLRAIDWQDDFTIWHRQVELAAADASLATTWESAGDGLQLQLSQNALFIDGKPAEVSRLRDLKASGRGPQPVYYLIDRNTTWRRIQDVNRALLASDVHTVHVVLDRKHGEPTVDRPPMPEVDKLLSRSDDKAHAFADYTTRLLALCPQMQSTFFEDVPNAAHTPDEADRLRKALVDGYRACDCAVSFEKLRPVLYLMLHDLDPVAFATVELDDAGGSALTDGDAVWGELYKQAIAMKTWHVE